MNKPPRFFSSIYLVILAVLIIIFPAQSFADNASTDDVFADNVSTDNAAEESRWDVSLGTGLIYNVPMPLTIRQSGYSTINTTARYDTHPFRMPPYYQIRISRWQEGAAWELEFIHQKLYLSNRPSQVQNFTITNGYNFFIVNRAYENKYFTWRVGLGAIITHPESTIRGQKFSEHGGFRGPDTDGYFLSGAVLQAAIEKKMYLIGGLFAFGELKLTAAYATVPIHKGTADAPNIAFHGLLGLGYSF